MGDQARCPNCGSPMEGQLFCAACTDTATWVGVEDDGPTADESRGLRSPLVSNDSTVDDEQPQVSPLFSHTDSSSFLAASDAAVEASPGSPHAHAFSLSEEDTADEEDGLYIDQILDAAMTSHLPDFTLDDSDRMLGVKLGNFHLLEVIGEGAFGKIYRAEHIHLNQPFAVKLLTPQAEADSKLIHRFRREAQALAQLSHENIVQLRDFGLISEGQFYMAMEYLEGVPLRAAVERRQAFPLARTRAIVEQLCSVLQYIHDRGVLHRDLTDANVLLIPDPIQQERVKVIDFGIAMIMEDVIITQSRAEVAGSPLFFAPELTLEGQDPDGRADLYALGVLLYLMLTGRYPFVGQKVADVVSQHLFDPPPTLADVAPTLPWSGELEAFLQRALAKDPADRPQDAASFWRECEQVLQLQQQRTPDWDGSFLDASQVTGQLASPFSQDQLDATSSEASGSRGPVPPLFLGLGFLLIALTMAWLVRALLSWGT